MTESTLFDTHIHVGQYYERYTSPTELKCFLDSVRVECFAASSTSICEGVYEKVIEEMKVLTALCGTRILPVLWIVPQMLKDGGLDKFIDSGIQWRCLKIHPQLHPTVWLDENPEIKSVASLAAMLQIPLLIHTGEYAGCYPMLYERTISKFPTVNFILAHGRPVNEAIELMQKYENVWVDTAFMPTPNIVKCCEAGFVDRVMWGSDYPIPKYFYPNENMFEYYANVLDELKQSVSQEDYTKITQTNARRLFNVN